MTDTQTDRPAASRRGGLDSRDLTAPRHTVEAFMSDFMRELNYGQGVSLARSSVNDQYLALARTVRHHLQSRWMATLAKQWDQQAKTVCYLSAEYLLGRQLDNSILASDLDTIVEEGLGQLGISLSTLRAQEIEPGLGNGGLGRLAACFIDSLATMSVPCVGYGIRYEYGIFRQTFVDGWQVEHSDPWLQLGNPWEFPHPENAVTVQFGGYTETVTEDDGAERTRWVGDWDVLGVPYNYMVPGYRNGRVNTLRLWSAKATRAFNLEVFNAGDYVEAVRNQTFAEKISMVLYPEDSTPQGKELRLQQQYFFVACSLRDFIDQVLPAKLRPPPAPRAGDLPAQRHPPGHRGAGAHADPRGRQGVRLGPGLGDHPAVLRLHVPHAAARGPRGVAGRAAGTAAAAPPRDHLPDQRRVPRRRCARPTRATRRGCAGCRSSPRAP